MGKFFFNGFCFILSSAAVTIFVGLLILPGLPPTPPIDRVMDCIKVEPLDTKDETTGYPEFKCVRATTAK